ncbi:MAG: hypothetical protein KC940_13520, partial [Candidatus Omnitrophica bacterium]|nr:hypothetical protein [Candidatus Omnitrophota bacterium]
MSYLTTRVNLPQALFQSAILFVLLMATANTGFSQTPTPDKGQVLFSNLIGAEAFIEELATHSRYLFSQEEQEEIDSLLERAEEAEGHSQIASSTEEIEEALTLQEEVNLYLKEFCQRVIQPIEYVIHEGGATTPGPVYQPLPSDHGTLFLRVESGTKTVGFSVVKMNLHDLPFSVEPPLIPYFEGGVTWVLVELKNIPAGKAVQRIRFRPVGHPEISIPSGVWVEGPEFGNLRIEVLDEEGLPTPYLIRLVERRSGKMRRPAGTLIFSDQMD